MSSPARLLAIVAVLPQKRVQCSGCGHGVYAAIHVVEENGQILVLGSTCFAKRFGSASPWDCLYQLEAGMASP